MSCYKRNDTNITDDQLNVRFEMLVARFGSVKNKLNKQFKYENESHGILRGGLGNKISTISAHHQMVEKKVVDNLDFVIFDQFGGEEVPKAAESKYGVPHIYTQFHPEFKGEKSSLMARIVSGLMSKNNDSIFNIFADAIEFNRVKKKVLKDIQSGRKEDE